MWHELFNVRVNAANVHIHGKQTSGGIPRILGTASGEKSLLRVIGTHNWVAWQFMSNWGCRKTISNAATNWITSNRIHRNDRCRLRVRKADLRIEEKCCATGISGDRQPCRQSMLWLSIKNFKNTALAMQTMPVSLIFVSSRDSEECDVIYSTTNANSRATNDHRCTSDGNLWDNFPNLKEVTESLRGY